MDLTSFIYDFNLVTTLTAKDVYERCDVINNGREKKIDYQNCITLYDLVETFNEAYKKFLEDKDEFKRCLDMYGEDVIYAYHSISKKEDFTFLCLDVLRPFTNVFDEKRAVVYLFKDKGEYKANATNDLNMFDKNYKNRRIDISEEDIKACLDIVEEHNLFLESLKDLKNKFVFGNGTTVVFTKIDGDMFDGLNTFTLTFGNAYFNTTDMIEIKIRLGETLEVLYDESKVTMDDEDIVELNEKVKIINELLSEIYINREKLVGLHKQVDEVNSLRKKDN